jgi:hypothetical protein
MSKKEYDVFGDRRRSFSEFRDHKNPSINSSNDVNQFSKQATGQ